MNKIKVLIAIFCVVISLNTQAQNIFGSTCEGNITRLDSLLTNKNNFFLAYIVDMSTILARKLKK